VDEWRTTSIAPVTQQLPQSDFRAECIRYDIFTKGLDWGIERASGIMLVWDILKAVEDILLGSHFCIHSPRLK
jgi:hypothetical protein